MFVKNGKISVLNKYDTSAEDVSGKFFDMIINHCNLL